MRKALADDQFFSNPRRARLLAHPEMARGRSRAAGESSDPEYLAPDFDASKLTKPQLRSILGEHGVTDLPPATARKEALLDLFSTHVRAKASRIKRDRAAVRPSAKGIAFLDEHSQPSPKRASPPRRPSPSPLSRRPSPSPSPQRKSSKSKTRAQSKLRGRSRTKERKTTAAARSPSPRVVRAATPSPPRSPSARRAMAESPLSALQKTLPRYSDSPQSATRKLHDRLEYIASANHLGKAKAVMNRSPSRSTSRIAATRGAAMPSGLAMRTLRQSFGWLGERLLPLVKNLFGLIVVVLVGFYIRWKYFHPFPYCETGVRLENLVPPQVHWTNVRGVLNSFCIRCPLHGECTAGKLVCKDGFVARPNLIAWGSDCVPDRRKLTLVDDIVGKIRSLLSERAGRAMCGEIEEIQRIVTEAELAQALQRENPLAEWNTSQFDSLYKLALQDVGKNPSVLGIEISHNPLDGMIMLQSTRPRVSLGCRMRVGLRGIYQRNRLRIWLGGLGLLALVSLVTMTRHRRRTSKRVEQLCQAVLQILAEQDGLHRRDPTLPNSISIHQIRDALFFKSGARTRNRLWPLVRQEEEEQEGGIWS